jgi:hypothetical protein
VGSGNFEKRFFHGNPAGSHAKAKSLRFFCPVLGQPSRSEGFETVFNDIIVHPNATGASIAAELDALSAAPSGVYP